MDNSRDLIKQMRNKINEIDKCYDIWSKSFGFTILEKQFFYILAEYENDTMRQVEICNIMSISKTTVNTIVKKMTKLGYITLTSHSTNLKDKMIHITKKGYELIDQMIKPLYTIEQEAVKDISNKDLNTLLITLDLYKDNLLDQITKKMDNQ